MEGVPPPSTSWHGSEGEVTTGNGVKVVHNPNASKLMFIPAKRAQSGKYTLKAKNQVRSLFILK